MCGSETNFGGPEISRSRSPSGPVLGVPNNTIGSVYWWEASEEAEVVTADGWSEHLRRERSKPSGTSHLLQNKNSKDPVGNLYR